MLKYKREGVEYDPKRWHTEQVCAGVAAAQRALKINEPVSLHQDGDVVWITLGGDQCLDLVAVLVAVDSILGEQWVPGWLLVEWRYEGATREEPEEWWDNDLAAYHIGEAAKAMVLHYAADLIDQALEAEYHRLEGDLR